MKKISDDYHVHYEEKRLWEQTRWLGVPIWKNPCDLLIFQELIFKVKPEVIIETGTKFGGSAVFFASVLKLMHCDGKVITMDPIDQLGNDFYDVPISIRGNIRINLVDSLNEHMLQLAYMHAFNKRTMVVLDSWHSEDHVLKELEAYHKFVSVGSYLVVEDTHINNPIKWNHSNGGPGAAVKRFLTKHTNFEVDRDCEKLVWTFNPGGFLKRMY